jgi:transposase
MVKAILEDGLWAVLQRLLPPDPPRPRGGRPRPPARQVLTGILFVLRSGIPWELLPQALGYGSGMTCWRRLQEGQAQGVWQRIHHERLNWRGQLDELDWSRASLDRGRVAAKRGGALTGLNPTDRAKAGTKRHVVVDRHGIPLAVRLTAANDHDGPVFEPLLDAT